MLLTEVAGELIVIVKAAPEDGKALRAQHEEITPGYHMNKQHWITLQAGGRLENLPRAKRPVDPSLFGKSDR